MTKGFAFRRDNNDNYKFKDKGQFTVTHDDAGSFGPFESERHAEHFAATAGMHRKNYQIQPHQDATPKKKIYIKAEKPYGRSVRGNGWDD